ncbi:TAT-variant-translocated molybdopterin oxidoreductase [Flavobacterium lindanitolerans]|jgi:molybdopterin-containing oxidoreductase family iron-sulfur binding subunit|uniref:Molybdopterin-containing oxidoreductase family iron-sulfur binding subunit n=2 Tax=Bacteria TaxID=2 RepID=A0A497UZ50_9FLAO|nr:TAT-variant-translocated molybdopterin oxidoreductase [Flavobacterium lindanitolerans]PKW29322.1 quinol:cytochrome c oxidoreductase iron-sulfur protein precursor [Flavobacterium lindanitolerans]RLJ35177.1 molybdopterin-containing oxidoreductase family iron-sulfur binding subunit [Flavobacterium lindanitolerans]
MSSNKKYWKSVEELNDNSSIVETLRNNEFAEPIPVEEFLGDKESLSATSTSRRDFLKYVGFSTAAASLAACEGPVIKSIPYVVQPEEIIPGVADYYATTMADGFDFANILIKTREGRPIKVENNIVDGVKLSANARVHASVLSLYDSTRLKQPKIAKKAASWSDVDAKVKASLNDAKANGGQVVLLTGTMASPSTDKLIAEFIAKNPSAKHVVYDAVSESNALDAFQMAYGERALADYDFSKSEVIVSVGADFLGDWQGGGFDSGYAKGRVPKNGKMSKHIQLESNMSLSGANADKRIPLTITDQKHALVKIYNIITGASVGTQKIAREEEVVKAAQQLKSAGSKGVLVSGLDDLNAQLLVFAINNALKSEAFNPSGARLTRKGDAKAVAQLVADMKAGNVHTLIMNGVNPVYTLAASKDFAEGLKKVKLSVAFSLKEDETAVLSTIAAPAPHYLESWGDVTISKGNYSIMQPTIRPLFDSRQFQEAILLWSDNSTSYYDYLKAVGSSIASGTTWNKLVHDGVYATPVTAVSGGNADYAKAASDLAQAKKLGEFELVLYTKTGMGDGQQANNPWLQEFPDPITRVSWDNYVTVSRADAEKLGVENYNVANGGLNGSYVSIEVGGAKLEKVPVIIQPGQAVGTIGVALGYGRKESLKEEMQVGVNAYTLYAGSNANQGAKVAKVSGDHEFACVQLQRTLMGRGDILKETTLSVFNDPKVDASVWNPAPMVSLDHNPVKANTVDLWDSFDRTIGHHFKLSIDLNSCTGCGACVIACHAENNVPVVGKAEVRRSRDMHWLRIDRYYSSEETFAKDNEKKEGFEGLFGDKGSLGGFGEMEHPSDNPQVAFQPVMCQHCNHAPCETVCPVAATSHGRQGQNHMAYNRCVGTRYCANNCPYKVRRFNWFLYNKNSEFDFHMNDDLGRMVLNPDVVVRSRGVMEKCSFCIQSTQAVILKAKREGRPVKEGEFNDACACSAACTSGSMVFGDVNEKESPVAKLEQDPRMYHLLEHVGTKPNVFYHVKVRNT